MDNFVDNLPLLIFYCISIIYDNGSKVKLSRKLIFFIVIVRRFFGAARHDFLLRFIKVFPDFPAEHAFPVHIFFHYSAAYYAVRTLGKHKFLADVHRVVVP
mgnify:CR=1 FL=1